MHSHSVDRKWLVLDGPIDPEWIENINSVLDDSKRLCLSSGETIIMKPSITFVFEVTDLAEVSKVII